MAKPNYAFEKRQKEIAKKKKKEEKKEEKLQQKAAQQNDRTQPQPQQDNAGAPDAEPSVPDEI